MRAPTSEGVGASRASSPGPPYTTWEARTSRNDANACPARADGPVAPCIAGRPTCPGDAAAASPKATIAPAPFQRARPDPALPILATSASIPFHQPTIARRLSGFRFAVRGLTDLSSSGPACRDFAGGTSKVRLSATTTIIRIQYNRTFICLFYCDRAAAPLPSRRSHSTAAPATIPTLVSNFSTFAFFHSMYMLRAPPRPAPFPPTSNFRCPYRPATSTRLTYAVVISDPPGPRRSYPPHAPPTNRALIPRACPGVRVS